MRTKDQNQMSISLFHPAVLERANKDLAKDGLSLYLNEDVADERLPFLELHDKNKNPVGLKITPYGGSNRDPNGSFLSVKAWISDDKPREAGNQLIARVMKAEEAAHQEMDGKSRPEYGVPEFSGTHLPTHMRARLAASNWHQNAGEEGGPVPLADPIQVMMISQGAQIRGEDGTLLRVPAGGYLARDIEGNLKVHSDDERIGVLEGVDRSSKSQDVKWASLRAVYALNELKNKSENEPSPNTAVIAERGGRSSVVCARQDGKVITLATYTDEKSANKAVSVNPKGFETERMRHIKAYETGARIATATRKQSER